jgi:hypothetical protein
MGSEKPGLNYIKSWLKIKSVEKNRLEHLIQIKGICERTLKITLLFLYDDNIHDLFSRTKIVEIEKKINSGNFNGGFD